MLLNLVYTYMTKFSGEHDKAVAMTLFYNGIDAAFKCLQDIINVRSILYSSRVNYMTDKSRGW